MHPVGSYCTDTSRCSVNKTLKKANSHFPKKSSSKENIRLTKKKRDFVLQRIFGKSVIVKSVKKSHTSLNYEVQNRSVDIVFRCTAIYSTCALFLKFTFKLYTHF